MSNTKHVIPSTTGGWAVVNSGSARATKVFGTRQEAVTFARVAARKAGTELVVHSRDGMISEQSSYAKRGQTGQGMANNRPLPPKR